MAMAEVVIMYRGAKVYDMLKRFQPSWIMPFELQYKSDEDFPFVCQAYSETSPNIPPAYVGIPILVYCLDESTITQDTFEEIKQSMMRSIEAFRTLNHQTKLVFLSVGSGSHLETMSRDLSQQYGIEIDHCSECSLLPDKLLSLYKPSAFDKAMEELLNATQSLPSELRVSIELAALFLRRDLILRESDDEKVASIDRFVTATSVWLQGKHPQVMNAVLTVAAVAAVTLLAAVIGFAIGFSLSLWSGPAAFFAGIMAGSAAATSCVATSSSLGLIAGGLTLFGMFNYHNRELNAIKDFADQVRADSVPVQPE